MKTIARAWSSISLVKRIIIGLIIGALLGVFAPTGIEIISLLGTLFVSALKGVAPVLVFFLVISALANARAAGSMKTIVILYMVSTFLAALTAVVASFLFPSAITLIDAAETAQASPQDIGEVLTALVMNIVSNPVDALMNANYIGILAWAIVLGIAMRAASDNTKQVFTNVSEAVSKVVRWVIACAPFGILGLVYTTVSENGLEIFTEYGHLLLVLVGCMLFIAFIINPLMVWVNMTLACCNTMNVSVDLPTAVILCVLAAVSACGASGVAGGSLLLIPLTCSLFGISNDIAMQVVAIGLIIGVIQDSCETALNSSSDALFTATADYREQRIAGKDFNPGKDAETA